MGLLSVRWSKDVLVTVIILLAAPLLYNLWTFCVSMWWKPRRIKKVFESQGIKCMPSHFFYGNLREVTALNQEARRAPMPDISHDIAPRMIPYFYQFPKIHGDRYVYWLGSQARFHLTNPEEVKEVLSTKFDHYPKLDRRPDADDLIGNGLVALEGEKWAQHRRIMNPAFFSEKLKAMVPQMVESTTAMVEKWDALIGEGQDIDVHKELKDLTADIIAHTAFGTSFAEGKQAFEMQHEQQRILDKVFRTVYIPGLRFFPTAFNRYRWKIDGDIRSVLRSLIKKRLESIEAGRGDLYGNDLLGLMMAANKGELQGSQNNLTMGIDDIIDECKTFFFAGHETTSTLLTWTFLLLASNPEWQDRAREEVLAECGMIEKPTADSVNHLRLVGMVLNEALRLYPPVIGMARKAGSDMQLGKIMVPKGVNIVVPILAWQHDERYWGPDVHEFHPERFSGGIAQACTVPGAFMPFSMGPRVCIGQNFALLEAKVVLSTILQRYRFRLSPSYQHAPITVLTLQPQFGMPILFEKL